MFGIDDAILAPIAGSVLGGLLGGESQGATQTVNKAPWSAAEPWLQNLLGQGQNLQNYYASNPFNPLQTNSYAQLLQGSDYLNSVVPNLMQWASQPTGYSRTGSTQALQSPTSLLQMPQAQQVQQAPAPISLPSYNPMAPVVQPQAAQPTASTAPATTATSTLAGSIQPSAGLLAPSIQAAQQAATVAPAPAAPTQQQTIDQLNQEAERFYRMQQQYMQNSQAGG